MTTSAAGHGAPATGPVPAPAAALKHAAPEKQPAASPQPRTLQAWLDAREREILLRTLSEADNDLATAAVHLGLSARQLHHRLKRLKMAHTEPDASAT